ncbi:gp53-like domain-containing protein [Enterobacter roggenkampii]|uniref:phage tail fiber protein n=1 Tax=Enterobacter roggenkampii TaxID=1812935 RepID=UPI000BA85A03|nr:hypothetical protein [Enterobacter roggenkampii]PAO24605.1 hypothetical protein CIW56_01360 [Enterobacter roggenkampii]
MILGFGNNVVSSLASDITSGQTTLPVFPGDGPLFAALLTSDFNNNSTEIKNYAKITLTDSGETAFEVCHLLAVSGDTLTVVRGQEGTAAKGWSLKDVVANFATRGSENAFTQIAHVQSGFYTAGSAGGTANALTLNLPTSFFLNGSTEWALKTPIVVYPTQNNTGPATLQLTMGGRVLGTFKLYKGNKAELVANDILKDVALVCLLDNTRTFFNVANPGAIYAGLGTAAFKDIVTSMTDVTAGRIPVVGWMGLGSVAPKTPVVSNNSYDNIPVGLPSGFWTHTLSGGPYAYSFALQQDGGGQKNTRHLIIPADTNSKIAMRWDNGSTFQYQYFYTDKNKPTASDVGAVAKTGDNMSGALKVNAEIQTTSSNSLRMVSGNYGTFWRQDGTTLYLMLTNAGDQYGSYNDFRPLIVDLRTGAVTLPGGTGVNGKLYAGEVDVGASRITNDGNIFGSIWGNDWLSNWVFNNFAIKNSLYAGTDGWFKDNSSGFIIQWGNRGSYGTGIEAASFNFAFPNNCLAVVASVGVNISNGNTIYTATANNQGFNYKASASAMGFKYIALGY